MRLRAFVKAKTAEELVELCKVLELRTGSSFNWEPVFFAQGYFYSFYNIVIEKTSQVAQMENALNERRIETEAKEYTK